ncbi:mandelate racemase/muconate lactonizing enzyme family protein [Streptomyces sp. NPDC057382]|uniref:mandelate racemase/muconate lactonizing enzyme family protein n=1 Tax=unclassified Streptomyces TaxID=2593676 RepID=UPI00363F5D67
MKISSIETRVVGAQTPGSVLSDRNYVFVLVHTDEGLTGLGEATLEGHDRSVRAAIEEMADLVVGEDPTRIEYLTQVMTRQMFWRGGVIKGTAVAGVELALWDIVGKSAGLPVHQLVGGAVRDRIRVYTNGWSAGSTDPVELRDRAQAAVAAGHRAFKFSLVLPSWPLRDAELLRSVATAAAAVREAVGPEAPLMFDGHGRYDADQAIAIGRVLEDVRVYFYEEPVQPGRLGDMARVAQALDLTIAAGERLASKEEFVPLLSNGAVSVVQPDLAHCHGFGEGMKIAQLADAFGAWIAPHGPMSPVLTAISTHLDAVAPNFLIQERLHLDDWRENVIRTPLKVEDGFLPLPTGPGWGIELDDEICSAHPRVSVQVPRLFRADSSVADW